MNRVLLSLPQGERILQNGALGIGPMPPLIVRGGAPVIGWAPAALPRVKEDLAERLIHLYARRDPELEDFLRRGRETDRLADARGLRQPGGGTAQVMGYVAEGAARLMSADDGPRIAALAFDGWDTHANEGGATGPLAQLLGGLDHAFTTLELGMKETWQDTVVMVVTEFGRTARVNGTLGTDHGTGTVVFLVGGAVKGGRILTDWPGLRAENLFEGRDLRPTTDVRAVAKGVLADLFGVSAATLAQDVFPETSGLQPIKDLVV